MTHCKRIRNWSKKMTIMCLHNNLFSDEPMTAALFAKIVLQSMKQSECFGWNKKLLVELEDYYESKASEVLIKLFEEDPAIASQSLRSKQESWYGYTPLELAERGKFFISNSYLVKKKRYKYRMVFI